MLPPAQLLRWGGKLPNRAFTVVSAAFHNEVGFLAPVCRMMEDEVGGRRFVFDVETPERTFHLSADTEDDARSWMSAFENCTCAPRRARSFWEGYGNGGLLAGSGP